MTWRHGNVAVEANERVEVWRQHSDESWFTYVGTTSMYEGEVVIRPVDIETMEFHDKPPIPTESRQVWRTLSNS